MEPTNRRFRAFWRAWMDAWVNAYFLTLSTAIIVILVVSVLPSTPSPGRQSDGCIAHRFCFSALFLLPLPSSLRLRFAGYWQGCRQLLGLFPAGLVPPPVRYIGASSSSFRRSGHSASMVGWRSDHSRTIFPDTTHVVGPSSGVRCRTVACR